MSLIPHHTSDKECPLCLLKLQSAHPVLQSWFNEQMKPKFPDAHVSWAYRDAASQEQAYDDKKSKLHFPNSAHNKTPAMALDLFEIKDSGEGVWNPNFFSDVNAINVRSGNGLLWGAHFRDLGDYDHFEYRPEDPTPPDSAA